MNKVLLSCAALAACVAVALPAAAADLGVQPIYKAPPPPPAAYNWSGFYLGAHVGGAWANNDWLQTSPAAFGGNAASFNSNGAIGGGQVGFNWQAGNWVLGIEADASASGQRGTGVQTPLTPWTSRTRVDWFGTATGRVGYAWDRTLVYAKGGFAWADENLSQTFTPAGGVATRVSRTNTTDTGWTVGGGIEYGLTDNWSAKLEYNFIDLGTKNVGFANAAPAPAARAVDAFDVDQTMHVVKFGVNYRFNGSSLLLGR